MSSVAPGRLILLLILYLGIGSALAEESTLGQFTVSGEWLSQHLDDPNLVIIDMTRDNTQYQRFHIPGALRLPYDALVRRGKDGVDLRVDDQRLYQVLGYFGITPDSHVVVYDDSGGYDAGRLFWELERIGHARMSVLDGGLVRWILDGRKVDNKPGQHKVGQYQPTGSGRANEVALDEVKTALGTDVKLLDVRSPEEYEGDPRAKRSGHIPGALSWNWERSIDIGEGFVGRNTSELLDELKQLGVTPADEVVTYCHSGHRAAQTYYVLRRLGFDKVRLYDGSIKEWAKDTKLPLALGKAP